MANLKLIRPRSLKEFVAEIEDLQVAAGNPVWFRGCGKANHPLVASFYRKRRLHPVGQAGSMLERQMLTRFRQRCLPFLERALGEDDWDTLFLMQHYGIPTRLLDWTENPFIALYFAVMDAKPVGASSNSPHFRSDVCVWAVDPISWNRQAFSDRSFNGGILVPGDDEIKGYKPGSEFGGTFPACIYGSHNSPRIVAQRGVFTVYGAGHVPMDRLHSRAQFKNPALTKIVIRRNFIGPIRTSLLRYGITESTIFPDLTGLALEVKRDFGY